MRANYWTRRKIANMYKLISLKRVCPFDFIIISLVAFWFVQFLASILLLAVTIGLFHFGLPNKVGLRLIDWFACPGSQGKGQMPREVQGKWRSWPYKTKWSRRCQSAWLQCMEPKSPYEAARHRAGRKQYASNRPHRHTSPVTAPATLQRAGKVQIWHTG